jgi:hypothetical protein
VAKIVKKCTLTADRITEALPILVESRYRYIGPNGILMLELYIA